MNASPLMMPNRKVDHTAAPVRPVYTTTTGQTPRGEYVEENPTAFGVTEDYDAYDPYCFVCSRCTDHFAEHDGLVEAGLAEYSADGSVRKTAQWDDAQAKVIAEAEYQ